MKNEERNARERAYDLTMSVWERWSISDDEVSEAVDAAFAADPTWSDTYVIAGYFLYAFGSLEQLAAYRAAAAFAEQDVLAYQETMAPPVDDVWDMVIARPYFRAWSGLARCLSGIGADKEAIAVQKRLLATKARSLSSDCLGAALLAAGRLTEYGQLEASADPLWRAASDSLGYFLQGRIAEADVSVGMMQSMNSDLSVYLASSAPLFAWPMTGIVEAGTEAQAVQYAQSDIGVAWSRHPVARSWLAQQVSASTAQRRKK